MIRRDGHGQARSTDPNLRHHSSSDFHLLPKNQYLRNLTGMVHNHPSGDPTPSEADLAMTKEVQKGCRFLGLTLHDHIIVGAGHEVSLRGLGKM